MKFIFFGTPEVARQTLLKLVASGLRPEAVVTNPDAPKGRGHVLTPSPVRSYAESLGVPVLTPESLTSEVEAEISAIGADLAIVVAYGKILPESLINSFPKGVLNIHYSLLPRWRGASPVESALLQGDQTTGVVVQKMVKKLDAGDIVSVRQIDIAEEDTTATLRPRLIELGADLLIETLPQYLNGEINPMPQDESRVTHAPKFKKEDGLIDLEGDALLNWRKYRAFAVWPGTYFFKGDKRHKIISAIYREGRFIPLRVIPEGGKEIDHV
jgi:methionyl-tRNA formyltransferase